MDKSFLEFWGNLFLAAAKGQEQQEEMVRWLQQGFRGYEDLAKRLQQAGGSDKSAADPSDYFKNWQQAQENITESFKEFLSLLNVVPRDEYLSLAEKYEELKEKVASQEETIRHLRLLLAQTQGTGQDVLNSELNSLLEKQTEQFQKLMENFGQMFKEDTKSDKTR